jgi:shikimate kinase
MKTNIALIGFMGAGKTTVARSLATRINREFIELDSLIELNTGKAITDIFSQDGEIVFREIEIKVTKDITNGRNMVIACGGGIVLNRINIDRLKKESVIVYLAVTPQVLFKRLTDTKNSRPLLNVKDLESTICELMKHRKPLYEWAADIIVDTTEMPVDSVVDSIVNTLSCDESFNL